MTQNKYLEKNLKPSEYRIEKTILALKDLKGNIKKIDQIEYCLNEKDEFTESFSNQTFIIEFDTNHKLTKSTDFSGSRNQRCVQYFHDFLEGKISRQEWYDKNNQLIYFEEYKFDSSDFAVSLYKKKNEGEESLIEFKIEVLNENNFIYHYEQKDLHYENNQLIKSSPNCSGFYTETIYTYWNDERSQKYYFKGFLSTEEIYKNDYLIKYIQYDCDSGKIKYESIRIYDDNHNMTGTIERHYDYSNGKQDISENHTMYIYDSHNLFIEKKRLMGNGEFHSIYANEYDFLGNLTSNGYNGHLLQYKYDEYNNWVEKIEELRSKVIKKTYRSIEYY